MGVSTLVYRVLILALMALPCFRDVLAKQKYPHLYRPLALGPRLKAYEVELKGTYFITSNYFDNDGINVSMDEGTGFSRWDGDISLRYGFSRQLKWEAGLRFRQNQSMHLVGSEITTVTAAGLESYSLGAQYSMKSSQNLVYALMLQARQTSYDNKDYNTATEVPQDEIVLGDSGTELSLGLGLSYQWTPTTTLDSWVAFRQPGNSLSYEVPYLAKATWVWTRLAVYLGVDGIYSLKNDEFSDVPEQKPGQARGATYLYNSLNREYLAPHAGFYYAFSNWRLGLEVAQVTYGVSTDGGTRVSMNLLWGSQGVSRNKQKVEKFKEYNIEATVIKVSPRGKFIQIDKGISSDIEKGMKFDVFKTDFFGGNTLIAEGIVYEAGGSKAIIKLTRKIREMKIKKGFVVRGQ